MVPKHTGNFINNTCKWSETKANGKIIYHLETVKSKIRLTKVLLSICRKINLTHYAFSHTSSHQSAKNFPITKHSRNPTKTFAHFSGKKDLTSSPMSTHTVFPTQKVSITLPGNNMNFIKSTPRKIKMRMCPVRQLVS